MSVVLAPGSHEGLRGRIGLMVAVALAGVLIGWAATYDPTLFAGLGLSFVWGGLFFASFRRLVLARVESRRLRALLVVGLALRVPIVLSHLAVGIWLMGGRVDFLGYFGSASDSTHELLQGDFQRFIVPGIHDIGGWLVTVMIVPMYMLFGGNLFGTFLVSGIVGFLGGVLFLRAFQQEFGSDSDSRFLARCLFFYPSVAFWSSLLGKDSWIFMLLGLVTWGIVRFVHRPGAGPALAIGLGVGFTLIVRPPIGAALCIAIVGAGLIASRGWTRRLTGAAVILRPIMFIVLVTVIIGGSYVTVIDRLRSYGVFGESASPVQGLLNLAVAKHVGLSTDPSGGGSSLNVRIENPTAAEALQYLPEAVLTFLFRPHVFEAHNALAMVAAIDGTVLIVIILWRIRHLLAGLRLVGSHPIVLYTTICFLLFTAGLSFEANFGAIVRHRIMVLPFLFILLALPRTVTARATASA